LSICYKETNVSYPFANRLNRLNTIYGFNKANSQLDRAVTVLKMN
jgi:hypothetical protein